MSPYFFSCACGVCNCSHSMHETRVRFPVGELNFFPTFSWTVVDNDEDKRDESRAKKGIAPSPTPEVVARGKAALSLLSTAVKQFATLDVSCSCLWKTNSPNFEYQHPHHHNIKLRWKVHITAPLSPLMSRNVCSKMHAQFWQTSRSVLIRLGLNCLFEH